MATSQLKLYNGALVLLGETRLASLSESREPRHILDNIWDNGLVDRCLEEGLWNFATRTREISYNPSISSDFGFQYAFDKASDFIRTVQVSSDEHFVNSLVGHQYHDEGEYLWCDLQTIYWRYVSNDSEFGGDLSLWPESFTNFVEHYLAHRAAPLIGHKQLDLENGREWPSLTRARRNARSKDAMGQGTSFPPTGSYVRSRLGGSRRRDGGRGGQLIG